MFDFTDGLVNGLECMIMQSAEDADKVIDAFEEAIQNDEDPAEIEGTLYSRLGIDPSNLMPYDKDRINDTVNDIWERYN